MNTFQIAQVLTNDLLTKGSFSGVYACDELTSIEINKYPKSFVVKIDPMELAGIHWIAIYFNEQMKGEFFDFYGKNLIHCNKHLLDFMNRNAVEWEHNKIPIQSAFSTVCGQYYIYFLYDRCRERSMSTIVNSFVNDELRNDQLISYDFVRRKYRHVHPSLEQDIVKQISRSFYRE